MSSFQARLRSVMRKREAIRPSAWRVTIYPFLYRQHVCANTQVLINQTRWVDDTLVYGCCFGGSQYYHDKSPSRNSPMRLRARLSTDSCHQRELQVSSHSSTARCERALVSKSNPIQREFNFFISMYIPTKIKHRNQ